MFIAYELPSDFARVARAARVILRNPIVLQSVYRSTHARVTIDSPQQDVERRKRRLLYCRKVFRRFEP